jgi:predicted site-specific integrase-resolvase
MTDGKEKEYLSAGEASAFTGIGIQTIRKMADTQEITCYKTPSGHRKFSRASLQHLCGKNTVDGNKPRINFLYTRVSSKKQLDDLSRQVEYVKRSEYTDYTLIQDVGSGINFKRKGIQTILDHCIRGTIGKANVYKQKTPKSTTKKTKKTEIPDQSQ